MEPGSRADCSDADTCPRVPAGAIRGRGGLTLIHCAVVLAGVSTVWGQSSERSLSQYSERLYTIEQGLPQNEVRSIAQTPDGYLWFGTRDGLARFDGIRFTVFRHETTPGIGHNMFGAMLVDRAGRLWIATGDGLSCYEHGEFKRYTERDGLPAKAVHSLLEDRAGTLWIGTWNGLAAFDGFHFRTFTTKDGLPGKSISGLAEDGAGGLWVGTFGAGLAHMVDGHSTVMTTRDGLPADFIQTVFRDRAGRLWVGTLQGSALLSPAGKFEKVPDLPGKSISFYEDRSGSIWAATDKTFARLRRNAKAVFEREVGPNRDIETLFEDRDGSLWVGTSGAGVARYRAGPFVPYTTHDGLANDRVQSVFQDSRGSLWIGMNDGLSCWSHGKFQTISRRQLGDGVIDSIAEDDDGAIWVATSKGVARFNWHAWSQMGTRDQIPVDVHVLYKDHAGRMWMGSPEGIAIWDHGRVTKITQKDGLPGNYVMSILEDRQGVVWVGTITGLARLDRGKMTAYTTAEGLLSNYVQSLYEDAEGTLWFCTPSGLHRFKNGRFRAFTTKDGMFADSTLRLLEDDQHRFWISSYRGIFRVSRDDLNALADGARANVESIAYGTEDGMKSSACSGLGMQPAGWKTRSGSMWFPTDQGVVSVDPSNLLAPAPPPPPVLEGILTDGVATSHTSMGPGTRRIDFLFAAPSSVKPESIEYRYLMQGYDDSWHLAGTDHQVSFTNLPQGTYRFLVSARRTGGPWSADVASSPIRVLPHFYQSRAFYLGIGLVALLLAWVAHSLRMGEAERRLKAIMSERSRVAQELHDTLLQSVSGTAMEIQGVSRLLSLGSTELAHQQLSMALEHLGNSMADARQAIWDLKCPEPCEIGLDRALAAAAQHKCAGGPQLSWSISGWPRSLTKNTERHVFRIGMEAITNAIRHSDCSHISVTLDYREDLIALVVVDDGRGFDMSLAESASQSNHWGLAGMRERAKQCCGRLKIESTLGGGTSIRLEAPLLVNP